MKCKTIHKKLIFFLEGNLSEAEMKEVSEHLQHCESCLSFADQMGKTLSIIETEKQPGTDPFFYTRLKARMEKEESKEALSLRPSFVRVLQPVALSALLLLGIWFGYKVGNPSKAGNTAQITKEQMIPYLNELSDEPLESFLMN